MNRFSLAALLLLLASGCLTEAGGPGDRLPAAHEGEGETDGEGEAGADAGARPTSDAASADAPAPAPRFVPVEIGFDDLPTKVEVKDQYAEHARFSSLPDAFNTTRGDSLLGGTPPIYLCAGRILGSCGSPLPTYIDFTKPVRKISFRALGVGRGGGKKFGEVSVASASGTATVDMISASATSWVEIDLSAFEDVTRIEITNDDGAGIGLDALRFEAPE